MKQSAHTPIFRKYPRMFLLFFSSILLLILCIPLEFALRTRLQAGVLSPTNIRLTDSLIHYPSYATDSNGIFKANPAWFQQDSLLAQGIRVNEDGFREIDFEGDTNALRLMFIGDSYVWGYSAEPITESFVDEFARNTAYQCWNFGIGGTDPAQYAWIAEQYIPQIRPDVVICCTYLGNDLMNYERSPMPHQPLWYPTNVGWLAGFRPVWIDGKADEYFDSAEDAYAYMKRHYTLLGDNATAFDRFCGKTVLMTFVWKGVNRVIGLRAKPQHRLEKVVNEAANQYLQRVQSAAEQGDADFYLIAIPPKYEAGESMLEKYAFLFDGMEDDVYECPDLQETDYTGWKAGHFHNEGHQKFAAFLQELIQTNSPSSTQFPSPAH